MGFFKVPLTKAKSIRVRITSVKATYELSSRVIDRSEESAINTSKAGPMA